MGSGAYRQREVSNENHEPAGMVGEGRVSRDYFRVPVGASWKTRVTGRFPKNGKPWKKAKNDHMRLSSEARMMMVVMIFMLMPLWDLLGREDYSRRGAMSGVVISS